MIGISIGDANGVGPELLLRAFKDHKLHGKFCAIGDEAVLRYCNEKMQLKVPLHVMRGLDDQREDMLNIYDLDVLTASDVRIGQLSATTGAASLKYVETGTKLALQKKIDALVTLPINKQAIRETVPDFSGHTGYIASLCGTSNYTMMLVSSKLIVTHVSTHVSLKDAIEHVQPTRILDVIRLTHDVLQKLGKTTRIAVAALNPHAGEDKAFGSEDSEKIAPAVDKARSEGLTASGPLPADTVFYFAINGHYDAVVCMYHDQGHIPIKVLDFEAAVNVTLGLPIVRTSVDHGTAFDIAYKGVASLSSLCNAFDLAHKLIQG